MTGFRRTSFIGCKSSETGVETIETVDTAESNKTFHHGLIFIYWGPSTASVNARISGYVAGKKKSKKHTERPTSCWIYSSKL